MTPPFGENIIESDSGVARRQDEVGPVGMFFREFLKHPLMVGSIVPSSARLISHMLRPVNWSRARVIVEYGPGVGTFVRPILERMAPDARLIGIDTNHDFITYLDGRISDTRFETVHGSAADIGAILADRQITGADYILSGLPFSTLPPGVGGAIVDATYDALTPGGAFLVYQFSRKVRAVLGGRFERIDVGFEPMNVPPAHLYWGWKD